MEIHIGTKCGKYQNFLGQYIEWLQGQRWIWLKEVLKAAKTIFAELLLAMVAGRRFLGATKKRWHFDYLHGARWISFELGFEPLPGFFAWDLREWAQDNPQVWGNEFGWDLFSKNRAFGKNDYQRLTLKHIADHWLKVAKRLYKLQNGVEL
jgi:hypothetical protein